MAQEKSSSMANSRSVVGKASSGDSSLDISDICLIDTGIKG
jgi:hypothetical protein